MSLVSRSMKYTCCFLAVFAILLLAALPALAEGVPQPWGMNLQNPGSALETKLHDFHTVLLWIISSICVFVLGLLLWVIVRYNKWTNPQPATFAHNTKLEIVWTLVPCLILIAIALISFPLLYYSDRAPEKIDMTLKVTGHQWYWSYEYPDNGDISFDSHAIWDSSDVKNEDAQKLIADVSKDWLIKSEPRRMLEVDNRTVLPVGKTVRVQVIASDVEHSWFVPALAVNRMTVPGHLNEVWIRIEKEGIYYGQCSMICGNGHGFMPIVIEGVSPEKFAAWVQSKKTTTGQLSTPAAYAAK